MNRQDYFATWHKKSNTTLDEFEKEYQERLAKSHSDFPQMAEAEREKYILSLIQTSLKRQLSSNAPKFVGMFISVDDPRDANNFAKEEARKKGYIDAEGNPVWWAEHQMVKQFKSQKAGAVIQPKIQRTSIGIFYEEKEGQASELHIGTLYDSENPTRAPPLNQWVRFRANCSKGLTDKGYSMNASSVTDFKEADNIHSDISTQTARDIIKRYFLPNVCKSFKDIPTFDPKNNNATTAFTVVRGMVADIRFLPKSNKGFVEISNPDLEMSLDDNVGMIGGFLADSLQIDFGIGSVALFVGRLSYKEDRKQYNLNVTGMIPENMVGVPSNLQKIEVNEEEM